ncbi:hypothetical protein VM1G_07487 [Cytospora mali]|uniref:Uncharacterized protein n=1 Tax=Cytospora mali TaxID=578113 RepID=A0A194W5Q2_CYTMA|nr:hypothetical protein VM1G_07487 [Valsa mali]
MRLLMLFMLSAKQPSGRPPRVVKRDAKRSDGHAKGKPPKEQQDSHSFSSLSAMSSVTTQGPSPLMQSSTESFPWAILPPDPWLDSVPDDWNTDGIADSLVDHHISVAEGDPLQGLLDSSTPLTHDEITSSVVKNPVPFPDALTPMTSNTCASPTQPPPECPPEKLQQDDSQKSSYQAQTCLGSDIVKDTNGLTRLSLWIYQLQSEAGSKLPTPHLCENITTVTYHVLKALQGTFDGSERGLQRLDSQYLPPGLFGDQWSDTQSRRDSISSSMYPDDHHEHEASIIDTYTFLLIAACYQRLLDLFKHICISMHMHMDNVATPQSSVAQVVMTTELISHLLGRLDRGLEQTLCAGLPANTASTASFPNVSKLTSWSNFDAGPVLPDTWSGTNGFSGIDDLFSDGTRHESYLQSLTSVIGSMTRRKAALRTHISVIKRTIEGSEKF